MRFAAVALALLSTVVACETTSTTGEDAGAGTGDSSVGDGGSSTGDGGSVDDNAAMTLSPSACQADLALIREEALEVREHPVPHKGDFFGFRDVPTAEGDRLALVSLVTNTVLAVAGQSLPGFTEDETLVLGQGSDVSVAPDYGRDNEPDYPVVFTGTAREGALNSRVVMVRSDTRGGTRLVIAGDDNVQLGPAGGSVKRLKWPRLGPQDDLYFVLGFDGDERNFLVQQAWPGAPFGLLLAEGAALSTGDPNTPRIVAALGIPRPVGFGSVLVRVDVSDPGGAIEGFAELRIDTFTGDMQCLATNTSISCGGVLVPDGTMMRGFGSDGASIGAVLTDSTGEAEFHYKVIGLPTIEIIERNIETQGFTFNSFKQPKVCGRDNAVYFIGSMWTVGRGAHDELMRINEDGAMQQLTQFGPLLDVEALEGEVPDEVRDWAMGYNCDAILYTWGPSGPNDSQGYEAYWAVYDKGDTIEVIDETPGRPNGNGEVSSVRRARSGIDPNRRPDAVVNIGPEGDFYFVPYVENDAGTFLATYAVATEPINRCRAPNIVNSAADGPDLAPGDGRCDTGNMIGSDPECTLRAALEETNANAGPDAIRVEAPEFIRLASALPPITSAVHIEGPGTIDGSAITDEAVGIDVRVGGVELKNLVVTKFSSHGLVSTHAIRVEDFSATQNCGWGLWLEAEATVTGTRTTSNFAENGLGDVCAGGGIFSRADRDYQVTLRISGVAISQNNGPGVLARGVVEASEVRINNNQGDGVSVGSESGSVRTRLRIPWGTLVASANRGHGISVEPGGVSASYGRVELRANCGWGLRTDEAPVLLDGRSSAGPSIITGNGATGDSGDGRFWSTDEDQLPSFASGACAGGGISVTSIVPSSFSELSRVTSATISTNLGPGIASTGPVRIFSATLERNAGPGVLFWELESVSGDTIVVSMDGSNRIIANEGSGVELEAGSILVKGELQASDNHGAGLTTAQGDIGLNTAAASGRTMLERNGLGGQCRAWREMSGNWIGEGPAECARNEGAHAGSGNITAVGPVIRDNGGSGLSAADPDGEGSGVLRVTGGEICSNGAPDQGESINYTGVSDVCSN